MFHQNRSANADRRASLVCFVTNFFPKLMRCFLSYCIKQNGLTNKYCNNTRNPSLLTPTELLLIQELPSIENFTIHLCYKFITLEELLPKPSNGWGKFPDEKRLEVEDDIERIRHAINEIITTNDDECTNNYFVKFLYKLERIIQRVQIALGNKTLYVIFKSFLIKNIDTEVVLSEFINVDIIRDSNIQHIKSQDRERYSKISAVITEFFPKLLRNILKSNVSPSMLYNLYKHSGAHWNYSEESQVNTLKSNNNYESLDASMLYKLFRTFRCVNNPTQGWGHEPTNNDLSISDDIERIRILRNRSAHRCDTRIDQTEFENQFLQFHDITRRISSDHENELIAIETYSLDPNRQIELERALHELEYIKERFEKDYVKYYWGNKFEMKIKDIRQRIKTGKVLLGKGTIAIDIELPNVDDTETRAKILNEFKDEVNEGDLKIKFIAAITGSIIIHSDIDTDALITDTSLQKELTSFMKRILNTGRLQITSFQWIDAVIFLVEGNMELDLNSSVAKSLRLQFNVDMDVFETDEQFESEMNACMQRTIKNLNGKGFIGEVTAIVDSGQSDNTEETPRIDTSKSSPITDKSVEFENWGRGVSGKSVTDFLMEHPYNDPSEEHSPAAKHARREPSIVDATEDEQLQAAMQASINQNKVPQTIIIDSDSDSNDIETFSGSEDEVSQSPLKSSPNVKSTKLSKEKSNDNKTNTDRASNDQDLKNDSINNISNLSESESSMLNNTGSSYNYCLSEDRNYKHFLGKDTDPQTSLMIRFPDGNRQQLAVSRKSKLMALVLYAAENGFSNERYELVANFPRRKLSYMDFELTLEDAGLFPQDSVFVQAR